MNEHFVELKIRLIKCLVIFCLTFLVFFTISDKLYDIISVPLLKQLPHGSNIITTKITTTFVVPLKLCFFLTILIDIPFFFYQIWQFIIPGMYENEKKIYYQ